MTFCKKIDPDSLAVFAAWIIVFGDFLGAVAVTESLKQEKVGEKNDKQSENSQLTELKRQIIQLQNEVKQLKREL